MATAEELRKKMAANSEAWHTAATQEEKDALHRENQALADQIGGMSYDSGSGVWSGGGTSAAAGSTSTYQTLNERANAGTNMEAYKQELENQRAWAAANPTATQSHTSDELHNKYAEVIGSTLGGTSHNSATGYYTNDPAQTQKAGQYGATVTPTTYNGQEGWSYVQGQGRTAQEGTSGADEDLMTDGDYAIIQQLKQQYAQAAAAGDREGMDNAHLEAERIRAKYNYSGGTDGSMYLTYGALANSGSGESNAYGAALGGSGSSSYGSGSGGSSYGSDLSEYLRQMYGAKTDAAIAELTAAYQQNVAAIENARAGLEEQYQSARNQTAGASELAARNFQEYAAAYGLNSGTGGQAELARNVTLQNNLNTLNAEEAQAYADLELAKANAEAEYNMAVAQAQATGDYELANALYQEQIRVQEQLAAQQQALLEQSRWEQELALSQQSSQNSQLAAYGQSYLEMGIMPSDDMLAAMGITRADAQAYLSAGAIAGASGGSSGTVRSSGGGSGVSTADYTGLFTSAKASGYPKSYIANNYKSYGFTSSTGLYDEYKGWDEGETTKNTAAETRYNGAVEDLSRLKANGASEAEILAEVDGILLDLERYGYTEAELLALLDKLGINVRAG